MNSIFVSTLCPDRLTLNLSFLAVGPPTPKTPADVPLIEMMTVEFVGSANCVSLAMLHK
jgi:hypothetical protein